MRLLYPALLLSLCALSFRLPFSSTKIQTTGTNASLPDPTALVCNCSITQDGNTYSINALQGNESAAAFYEYGIPAGSSANTGLELPNALILFLYEDINTGIISLFLIADIQNDGTGGSLEFEFNCAPVNSFISVQDDGGEFFGTPPLFTGDWNWSPCCTDGGVIENIGCNSGMNLDLLIANGIDSIVWLTGDIANPTHILLDLTGDDIMINCGGGGICCPVDLDTESTVIQPTCPDTPNGSISVSPQDGIQPYSYNWSNGANTAMNDDLLPGSYQVTITDAQGCMEILNFNLTFNPGPPPSAPAAMQICSDEDEASFDLTTIQNIVNAGSGFPVHWFENMDLTGEILNPSNYVTGTTTIYAVTDNNSCFSMPVPVTLTVIPVPIATPTSISVCEVFNEEGIFNLTELEDIITGGGGGTVHWYEVPNLSVPIGDPEEFQSASTTVYAVWEVSPCLSEPVPVMLSVDLKPEGEPTDIHLCGDENNEAIFDLTAVETLVSSGNGSITWYSEIELLDEITAPNNVQTTTTTVYAVIFDGFCNSDPIPVDLIVENTPIGNQITANQCDNGSGEALFDLPSYDQLISGGLGGVDWFYDIQLTDPILNPSGFLTESTVVYAVIDNGTCISEPIAIPLIVFESPVAEPASLETCADSTGQGIFNLTLVDTMISGGIGTVSWYENVFGDIPIVTPTAYTSGNAIVYAQVTNGICLSNIVPVTLGIINTVSANPATINGCDSGNGTGLFDLNTIANNVSSGTGIVNWYTDAAGTLLISNPGTYSSVSDTIYAQVIAGTCASEIVPIELTVVASPVAIDTSLALCGDANGLATIDLTLLNNHVSGSIGTVNWYSDAALSMPVATPGAVMTGDTSFYAAVSLGSCVSPAVNIDISVDSQIIATPVTDQFCHDFVDPPITIDLNQYNNSIAGIHAVNWFSDAGGVTPIANPTLFQTSTTTTVYASAVNGECQSALVPVILEVFGYPMADPFTFKRCGDVNGEALIDLTSADHWVSSNTGTVNWYWDNGLINQITEPWNFLTSDTIIYATVTNVICTAGPVLITIEIVDSLVANPAMIDLCIVDAASTTVDLTQYNGIISGGNGAVSWFSDANGMNTIADPASYITSGGTVYSMVSADGCISDIIAIPITVEMVATPVASCIFTSIDSVAFDWTDVTSDYQLTYTINGNPVGIPVNTGNNQFSLGGLGQGDIVTLTVSALFNSICTEPLETTVTCVTDVCAQQSATLQGLQGVYCKDETFILLSANPAGGIFSGPGISNDTLYPGLVTGNTASIQYDWEDNSTGCVYDTIANIEFVDPPLLPFVACSSTLSSVTFTWADPGTEFVYMYSINGGPLNGPVVTANTTFDVTGLSDEDEVEFTYWTVGEAPCANSDTITIACTSLPCPNVLVNIPNVNKFCSVDDPSLLNVNVQGASGTYIITWEGEGITDPAGIFDPGAAPFYNNLVTVTIEADGCVYNTSKIIQVVPTPDASLTWDGTPCVDSVFTIAFNGVEVPGNSWSWNMDFAHTMTSGNAQVWKAWWKEPGDKLVVLGMANEGCTDTFFLPLTIDAPLEAPVIYCVSEDYYELEIGWDPVPGATQYIVNSSIGNGSVSGTTYKLKNLPDNTAVNISVTAIGNTACGPSNSEIECTTLDYIPLTFFIPTVFSPNHDNINDIFFIKSNSIISNINSLHIFDRWGNLVFENEDFLSNDEGEGWDGTYNGKEVNPGVFVYLVEFETAYGETVVETGDVTLIR